MYRCHFLSLQQGRCLEKSLTRRTHFKYRLLRIAAHPRPSTGHGSGSDPHAEGAACAR